MKMLVNFHLPHEPFNSMVRDGSIDSVMEKVLGDIKPEQVYFVEQAGVRGGFLIIDMADGADIPRIAEPLFLAFEADVEFRPIMTLEELGRSGISEIGERYQ